MTTSIPDVVGLGAVLRSAGFVAAEREAEVLLAHASGDRAVFGAALARRLGGEPLAWIVGETMFFGATVSVRAGVYVPRRQSESLVRRAIELLPRGGTAVDVCTGTGAIARAIGRARPDATVVASDIDPRAVACARANGVEAFVGDLLEPVPAGLRGRVDLVVGVVPYVPSAAMSLLQRDTLAFESGVSYDGGDDGVDILRRVVAEGTRYLRHGGSLLLELGADQAGLIASDLERAGYSPAVVLLDDDRDPRGIETTFTGS
ncbi:MAG: HemK/PrmC family methyltransferase [Ilumatobacteraceae bacterium]|nr:HemK/PrmC family methyltransferase [Ilumatobacteraceae bacterium]